MIALDTNIFLYALNQDCPEHAVAARLVAEMATDEVVVCELVLVELYLLLRNPKVVPRPLSAARAAEICERYRAHPPWRLVDRGPVMDAVWRRAATQGFARRKIIDARLALTLLHHGVTEVVTRNVKDFEGFGFARLTDPFA